jgi:hypothetical protein
MRQSVRATDGTRPPGDGGALADLLAMAIPICQEAERRGPTPRTGPGRPPVYADWQVAALIVVAVLKKRKTKSAQYRFLSENRAALLPALGLERLMSRSDYFDRHPRAAALLDGAVAVQGRLALREHAADATVVAVDKSLVPARGPPWHRRDRQRGVVPAGRRGRGVDREAAWGYSGHDDWVYGYSYEVVVTATRGSVPFPLLASAGVASASEHRTFAAKAPRLPRSVRFVDADAGYDSGPAGDAVERDARTGRPTGRRFLCPPQPRAHGPAPGRSKQKGARARSLAARRRRYRFYASRRGRQVYRRRAKTVEPFNQWFKHLFEIEDAAWHRGLGNNRTMILAAVFCYQLLVRYNRRRGRRDACVQWILDGL